GRRERLIEVRHGSRSTLAEGSGSGVVADRHTARVYVVGERLHEPFAVVRPALTLVERDRVRPPPRRQEPHPEASALARELLGLRQERGPGPLTARLAGDDQVVDARLRPVVAQALVVLHVDDPNDPVADLRDEGDALDPADVTGELQLVRDVAGGAVPDAAIQLDEPPPAAVP